MYVQNNLVVIARLPENLTEIVQTIHNIYKWVQIKSMRLIKLIFEVAKIWCK